MEQPFEQLFEEFRATFWEISNNLWQVLQTLTQLVTLQAIFSTVGGILTQQKKRASHLHENLRLDLLDLDKLARPRHFQTPVLLNDRRKMIYMILIFISSPKLSSLNELDGYNSGFSHHFKFGRVGLSPAFYIMVAEAFLETQNVLKRKHTIILK